MKSFVFALYIQKFSQACQAPLSPYFMEVNTIASADIKAQPRVTAITVNSSGDSFIALYAEDEGLLGAGSDGDPRH